MHLVTVTGRCPREGDSTCSSPCWAPVSPSRDTWVVIRSTMSMDKTTDTPSALQRIPRIPRHVEATPLVLATPRGAAESSPIQGHMHGAVRELAACPTWLDRFGPPPKWLPNALVCETGCHWSHSVRVVAVFGKSAGPSRDLLRWWVCRKSTEARSNMLESASTPSPPHRPQPHTNAARDTFITRRQ
jgi:hypothetical protein